MHFYRVDNLLNIAKVKVNLLFNAMIGFFSGCIATKELQKYFCVVAMPNLNIPTVVRPSLFFLFEFKLSQI